MIAHYLEYIPDVYLEDGEPIELSPDFDAFVLVSSKHEYWDWKVDQKEHKNFICLSLISYVMPGDEDGL